MPPLHSGVPSEYNEFLPHDTPEYKRWKSAQEGGDALEKLQIKEKEDAEVQKLPGGKVKKKSKPAVMIAVTQRQKNKSTTRWGVVAVLLAALADADERRRHRQAANPALEFADSGSPSAQLLRVGA